MHREHHRRITVDSAGEAVVRPMQIDAISIGGFVFAASTAPQEILDMASFFVDNNGTVISTQTCEVVAVAQ